MVNVNSEHTPEINNNKDGIKIDAWHEMTNGKAAGAEDEGNENAVPIVYLLYRNIERKT